MDCNPRSPLFILPLLLSCVPAASATVYPPNEGKGNPVGHARGCALVANPRQRTLFWERGGSRGARGGDAEDGGRKINNKNEPERGRVVWVRVRRLGVGRGREKWPDGEAEHRGRGDPKEVRRVPVIRGIRWGKPSRSALIHGDSRGLLVK